MYFYYLVELWFLIELINDGNEMYKIMQEIILMLCIIDFFKVYDKVVEMICFGGVILFLLIFGFVNIIGGEGMVVKNVFFFGEYGEFVVEEMFLEYGVLDVEWCCYMKMVFGENLKIVWGYICMGVFWYLRKYFEKVRIIKEK